MSKEAMKLALEALENHPGNYKLSKAECAEYRAVEDAIREALAEQPAQQEPVHEFAYKAITKHGHHCHFGTHEAARSWAGEGGEVETIKLRHFELVKTTDTSPPAQRKPLTDEMVKRMKENCTSMEMRGAFADGWLSAEAAHGIKEKNT